MIDMNMGKKLGVVFILFALLFNVQVYASWNGEVSQPPQNNGVYEVSTPAELAWIAANGRYASVLLLNDIDFGAKWDASGNLLGGKAWTPFAFSGVFVTKYSGDGRQTKIRMPDVSGIYLVKIKLSNIETQIIKIIVE